MESTRSEPAGAEVGQIFHAWVAGRTGRAARVATPSEPAADAGRSDDTEPDTEKAPDTSVFAEVVTAAIPALPLLLPLLLIGILTERDVFSAILWQGNLLALTLGLVPLLIPFLAFSALYLLLRRFRGSDWHSAWQKSCLALALLPLVPPTVGLAQAGIVAFGFVQVVRQGTGQRHAGKNWLTALTLAVGLGLVGGGVWLGTFHGEPRLPAPAQPASETGSIQRTILGRLYTGMPQERIVVYGEPRRAYFVVHVDDNAMTAVTSYPSKVWTFRLNDIKQRTPCVNREVAVQRSLLLSAGDSLTVSCQEDSSELVDPTARYARWINAFVIMVALAGVAIGVRAIWRARIPRRWRRNRSDPVADGATP